MGRGLPALFLLACDAVPPGRPLISFRITPLYEQRFWRLAGPATRRKDEDRSAGGSCGRSRDQWIWRAGSSRISGPRRVLGAQTSAPHGVAHYSPRVRGGGRVRSAWRVQSKRRRCLRDATCHRPGQTARQARRIHRKVFGRLSGSMRSGAGRLPGNVPSRPARIPGDLPDCAEVIGQVSDARDHAGELHFGHVTP